MKLKEIIYHIGSDVVIYQSTGDNENPYVDLYKGNHLDMPKELFEREIRLIAAKRTNVLDIWVKDGNGKRGERG